MSDDRGSNDAGTGPIPDRLEDRIRALTQAVPSRRTFLIGSGAAGAVVLAACTPLSRPAPPTTTPTSPTTLVPSVPASTKTLVVLEMAGGHDGYSMLIPYQNTTYYQLRPTVSVPAAQVIPLAGQPFGLHPNLVKLQNRNLAFIQGVGPPNPNDSHFNMIARWWEADIDGAHGSTTGFFGRLCDAAAPPSAPAGGIAVSWRTTPALVSSSSVTLAMPPNSNGRYPAPFNQPASNAWMVAQRAMATANGSDTTAAAAARAGMANALTFSDATVSLAPANPAYPSGGLGQQLSLAARLIKTSIGAKIIYVPWDGDFDTHSMHRNNHDALMTELDAALDAFLGDIDAANHGNDVLVASISEFGRRAAQNTDGLDHGTTSVMFLAGAANGGIYGQSPNWGALDANGNLVSPISLADYYATLAHWLGVSPASVLPVSGNPIAGVVS
jgi:uncharacterized protein (DUF1501 family)